ncbi:DoxX family protein [Gramella sp. GC03-9]|uniref:DoxX family protein n=1 Tax=Christiangramia oceanisediminis TaxID=2920386 RepID=A0A9X2KY30_9FLAO|nr:DoxX family protein [Gramella oceanisediminis]MCP9200369.1 DoxX family protein [Gramella oceanisediminis]
MNKNGDVSKIKQLDYKISRWMYVYGKTILRYSLALVFIWFGSLKITGDSPATEIVEITVFWLKPEVFIPVLGIWEILIGLFLIFKKLIRLAILLLVFQMPGTFLPLIIHPEVCFKEFPLILSMEGQYVIKNLILISAGIVIGGTVREPEFVERDIKSSDAQHKP